MKTLRVSETTWDRIRKHGYPGDSQDALLVKILDKAEK